MRLIIIVLWLSLVTSIALAQSKPDSSKNKYDIFNPTPKNVMRDFETDRPDVTESAYSVDAGHFQFETDLFRTEKVKINGVTTISNAYNLINLKIGLSNTMDLQVVVSSFETENLKFANIENKNSGFGDISIRLKKNLWGNDGGKTALAAMPYISLPTANGAAKVSGGLIFPFALSLPNDWGFGAQIESDVLENQNNTNYHLRFLSSATISHSLFKKCNFFIESYYTRDTEVDFSEYFANGGIIYELTENLKLDAGFNYGIKEESSKVYFIGLSFRY